MRWFLVPLLALPAALFFACVGSDPEVDPGGADANVGDGSPSNVDDGAPSGGDGGEGIDAGGDDAGPPCTPDLFCQPANPCKKGMCNAAAQCIENGDVIYGTACGTSGTSICKAGVCEDTEWALWTMPSWAGAAVAPVPSYSFESTFAGETTVDSVTGLTWTANGPTGQTWAQAKAHCDGLTLYGSADWRLPTSIELVSIGDVSQASGYAAKFGTVVSGMWSSTPVVDTPGNHWSMSSLRVTSSADTATFEVRCVR